MTSTNQSFQRAVSCATCVLLTGLLILLSSCTGDEAPLPPPSESAPVASSESARAEQEAASESRQEVPESDTTDHTGGLQGVVRNAEGEPLAPASLFFPDLEIGAATRGDGHYVIHGVPPGTRTLTVSHGELQKEIEVEILPDSLVQRDITLD